MTAPAPVHGGFAESEMNEILAKACSVTGLEAGQARLLRGHTNAVVLLADAGVVVKIARHGTRTADVSRTVRFVRHLMETGFPTVPLHPVEQPVVVDGHAVTFWTYLPQPPHPVSTERLARPLRALHTLALPDIPLPVHNNLRAIRRSLSAITSLAPADLAFLSERAGRLEEELAGVCFELAEGAIQGDPQHRNALHTDDGGVVLSDWDTAAVGHPEWDLITIEVHCRRFGYGPENYRAFAEAYGFDITRWPGYRTLRDIRELRMITTNARKTAHTPGSLGEVQRRVEGVRNGSAELEWRIL